MILTSPPTRTQAVLAYGLSAATTLIWIACVIPAGVLADPSLLDELATPMHREAVLLVPALLLLIALPIGFTLSRREEGLIAVLSSTDAFVAFYAGIALTLRHAITSVPAFVAVGLLFVLGALSSVEAWRAARAGRDEARSVPQGLRGARLALCVVVLMIPPDFLLQDGAELASWLGPFVFVALSAAGVRLSRTGHGLRLTASILQLLIAIHVIVTISYTLEAPGPDAITRLGLPGQLARWLSFGVAGLALLQCLALLRRPKAAPAPAPIPSSLEAPGQSPTGNRAPSSEVVNNRGPMRATPPPSTASAPKAPTGRARTRLLAILLLCVCWILPWPDMELDAVEGQTPEYHALIGAERTGAIGGLSLLAIWGLAATALASRTQRGLRIGLAVTEAAVATGITVLLLLGHPWIPGGDIREAWGAIFGPLALLALLEAATLYWGGRSHRTVAIVRAGAAVFASGCLAVSLAWVPAGVALWLAISPLLFLKVRTPNGGRRGVEALLIVLAIVHGFSFHLHDMFVGVGVPSGSHLNLPFFAWGVLTAIVTVTALDGLFSREDDLANPA